MALSLRVTLTLWLAACFPRALELRPVYLPLTPLLLISLCALFRTPSRLWPLCSMVHTFAAFPFHSRAVLLSVERTHDATPLFQSTTMSVLLKTNAS
ncbi:hypothetical protein B0H13DRAFT_1979020, partial [Mycena leptocephala]